ncbi:MAG TPA: phosphate propanoyltransferase [Bacillota bacterium]|nr:phosphate propanoyltransferase [Bacillota bacterium]HPZ90054.1 phosphate propanoyltransferase [Bacillota bacterium]HQE01000.1 phosphate propanoyltransferase [Bacillota bacterium]
MLKIPVGVSNRHVHLSAQDLEKLFGPGYQLTRSKDLGQPGQYAADEKVELIGPRGSIAGVRVLGPSRNRTQVEISRTDSFKLGISPPVRDSGELDGSAPITIKGPLGSIELQEGAIIAHRHIHITPDLAEANGLEDKQLVSVRCDGPRALTFDKVLVRVSENFSLEFHVDVDEANAALLNNGDLVTLLKA